MKDSSLLVFYGITLLAVLVSLSADRARTGKAFKIAWTRLRKISPMMMGVIILVSVSLYFISDELILLVLGNDKLAVSLGAGTLVGSIAMIPGFVVFPLCGLLSEKGVPYIVLAGFTTTLMMVGIVSFPMEKGLFGLRFALARNITSLLIALAVSLIIGFVFGEIAL